MHKKLLVTGGAGFIGSNFIHYWLKTHPQDQIVNLDKLTYAGNLANLKDIQDSSNYKFIRGDIADADAVAVAMRHADTVVHFAAESIPENIYIPINSATGTRVITFGELWKQQAKKNKIEKTSRGEVIFLRGKQTKALSFLNTGQWMPIKAITRHWYKGKIIKLVQKHGIIEATPNHSIYSSNLDLSNPEDNPELLVIRSLNEIRKKFKKTDRKILKIIAAYVTEGNATFNKANGSYIVEIGQKDKQWLEEIGKAIQYHFGCKFNIMRRKRGKFTYFRLQTSSKKLFNHLVNSCGQYSNGKFFPNWIFDLSPEDREFFWEKLLEGDGTKDKRYTTTSYKLANQISLLLTLQKKPFTVFERNPQQYKRSFEFKTLSTGAHHGLNVKKKSDIQYEGWVYDIEVEKSHNFVCGIGNTVCHNTHVDRSILGPGTFITTNVVGTQVLLNAALEQKVRLFLHVSTDEVYGDLPFDSKDKFNEQSCYRPSSPYAASKAAADHLVRAYHRTYNLPVIITNCSNNYGPYMFPEKLIPLAITNLLAGKKAPMYDQGQHIRDWLYVEDHCRALDAVINKGKIGQTYCIGGLTSDVSNKQVLQKICQILGKDFDSWVESVPDRPGHDRKYALDWSKIHRELGWQPRHDFDTWLEKTVKWYEDNKLWLTSLKTTLA